MCINLQLTRGRVDDALREQEEKWGKRQTILEGDSEKTILTVTTDCHTAPQCPNQMLTNVSEDIYLTEIINAGADIKGK